MCDLQTLTHPIKLCHAIVKEGGKMLHAIIAELEEVTSPSTVRYPGHGDRRVCYVADWSLGLLAQEEPADISGPVLPLDVLGVCARFLGAAQDCETLVNLNTVSLDVRYITNPTAKHTLVLRGLPPAGEFSTRRVMTEIVRRSVETEGCQHTR